MKLQGARCIITGASRGIGHTIATRFIASGAQCYLLAQHAETLKTGWKKEPLPFPRSITDIKLRRQAKPGDAEGAEEQWPRLRFGRLDANVDWDLLADVFGDVDVLVNAAGITEDSLFIRTSPAKINAVQQINLSSTIYACRSVAHRMIGRKPRQRFAQDEEQQHEKSEDGSFPERRDRCIINISSLLALRSGAGSVVYYRDESWCIGYHSFHAPRTNGTSGLTTPGLTHALAAELGRAKIRVNAIVPGYIETAMTENLNPKVREQALRQIPAKRFGTPQEVADAAVFLVQNEYANNCILNLDGGLSAV